MIIDEVLDRKNGKEYDAINSAQYFYDECKTLGLNYKIADAIVEYDEESAKKELCRYIDEQGYSKDIKDYINSVNWAMKETEISDNQKWNFCIDYVMNSCYCMWDLFVDNVGSKKDVISKLKKCNTRKEIKEFVHNYI